MKYSPNSCSSFMALSKTLLACSYVCLRFISLPRVRNQLSSPQWGAAANPPLELGAWEPPDTRSCAGPRTPRQDPSPHALCCLGSQPLCPSTALPFHHSTRVDSNPGPSAPAESPLISQCTSSDSLPTENTPLLAVLRLHRATFGNIFRFPMDNPLWDE